jgi:hypothetical protein
VVRLRLLDAHTGATFDAVYRDAKGPIARVMDELYVFLRDQHSGRMTNIDVGVIDFLANVMAATGRTVPLYCRPFVRSKPTRCWPARPSESPRTASKALDVRFANNYQMR